MAGPVPAVGQVYRVTFDLTMFGQKLMNTFSYRLSTVGTEVDSDAVCTAMDVVLATAGNMLPKYRPCVAPSVAIDNLWIQNVYPARVRKLVFLKATIGTAAGTSNTANLALSIERRGVLANRHNVGRVQIPAPDDIMNLVNGSFPAGAYLTAVIAFAAQMLVPITTAGGSVLGPVLTKNPIDATFANVTEAIPKTTARCMRRRTVGVGK